MSIKDKVKDVADKVVDKYDDEAYAARDDLKGLWARNTVFRVAVVGAAIVVVLLLVL